MAKCRHKRCRPSRRPAGRPASRGRAVGRSGGRAGGRPGRRAGGNTCLGKTTNNMLRLNPESNGGRNQIIQDQGRPEHVIGPSPYILDVHVCIHIYIHMIIYIHIYTYIQIFIPRKSICICTYIYMHILFLQTYMYAYIHMLSQQSTLAEGV